MLVLEELEHAKARGARIYAELVGYGANSDGYDVVAPSGVGGEKCLKIALAMADAIGGEKEARRREETARGRSMGLIKCMRACEAGSKS